MRVRTPNTWSIKRKVIWLTQFRWNEGRNEILPPVSYRMAQIGDAFEGLGNGALCGNAGKPNLATLESSHARLTH